MADTKVLTCARCLAEGTQPPHLLPAGLITRQTPIDAREHFRTAHGERQPGRRTVVVAYDGEQDGTFDLRSTR